MRRAQTGLRSESASKNPDESKAVTPDVPKTDSTSKKREASPLEDPVGKKIRVGDSGVETAVVPKHTFDNVVDLSRILHENVLQVEGSMELLAKEVKTIDENVMGNDYITLPNIDMYSSIAEPFGGIINKANFNPGQQAVLVKGQ